MNHHSKYNTIDFNKGTRKINKFPLQQQKLKTSSKFTLKRTHTSKLAQSIEKQTKLQSKTKKYYIKSPSKQLSNARLINQISNVPKTINFSNTETSIM